MEDLCSVPGETNIMELEPKKVVYSYNDFLNIMPHLFDTHFSCDNCDKINSESDMFTSNKTWYLASELYFDAELLKKGEYYNLCEKCYDPNSSQKFIKPELKSKEYYDIIDSTY